MIHNEVKSCESRWNALWEAERQAREYSCTQLRSDLEAMVTIVEALSAQVQKAPTDSRLDAFLEQEKRARDSLREDIEDLADQVSCLEKDRAKDAPSVSLEDIKSLLEQERAARDSACAELRKDLDALSTVTDQQRMSDVSNAVMRKDLDFSNAVLRKDFKKDLEALSLDVRATLSSAEEARINEMLEKHRDAVDATCAAVRKEVKALSTQVLSLPSPDVVTKCTGGTGNSEDGVGMDIVSERILSSLHRQKEEVSEVEALTEQLRLDLASSSQVVHLRLEKVDQAINDLQWDMRAAQIRDLAPRTNTALRILSNVCGRL